MFQIPSRYYFEHMIKQKMNICNTIKVININYVSIFWQTFINKRETVAYRYLSENSNIKCRFL